MEYELYHWGIKGMKWGVRRYQNKDGSLTPAGQKRRAKLEAELKTLGKKSAAAKTSESAPRKKTVGEMSDDELRSQANRMRLEKDYYDAANSLAAANPKKVSAGKKFATKFLDEAVIPAVTNVGKAWLENFMKNKLGLKSLKDKHEEWDYKKKISDAKKSIEDNSRNNKAAELENLAKRAKAEYEIADYMDKLANVGKPKNEKIDWESRNKEQQYIKGLFETEKANRSWNQYQEDLKTMTPEEAWENYVKRQGGK